MKVTKSNTRFYNNSDFVAFLSGLSPNTKYYIKAFILDYDGVNNLEGIYYGQEIEIVTKDIDSIIDIRDNQSYKIVTIGNQIWMAENLNYNSSSGSFEYEDNEKSKKLGRLYTYEGALMACPDGWHLPTDEEWKILEKKLGVLENEMNLTGLRGDSVGIKLKEPGSENWENTNMYSTNETGFTAIPGGIYNWHSKDETQISDLRTAFYLTSTLTENSQNVYIRLITSYENGIERKTLSKNFGYSVRCVKD